MTVTTIKPISETLGVDSHGPTITTTLLCEFTGAFDSVYIYQNAAAIGIPQGGDYVTGTSSDLWCSHCEATIAPNSPYTPASGKTGAFHWTCVFSTITPDRLDLSPLSRPMTVTGGGIDLTEVRRIDINGNAIVNSVGDYYENLPDFYVPGSEMQLTYNVASNPLAACTSCSFTTNNESIWGQAAYSGVIGKVTAQQEFETYEGVLIEYWKMTVPVRFRNDDLGWGFQTFDYGYRYNKSGASSNPTPWKDDTTGVYGPVLLDGAGNLLNGNGTAPDGSGVIFPAASGSMPAGYQTLHGSSWGDLLIPANPFSV